MAEMNKTQQTGSGVTDINELQSTRAGSGRTEDNQQVEEYRRKAEQVWDDTKKHVQTYKEDAEQYVRENPTKMVLTALAVGFALGLITFRR